MSNSFLLAMAQMLVEGGKPDANLARAERMIANAAAKGAQVVVLPECMNLGWTHPSTRELAQPIPGAHCERLAKVTCPQLVKKRLSGTLTEFSEYNLPNYS